jgi:hypothetical protein
MEPDFSSARAEWSLSPLSYKTAARQRQEGFAGDKNSSDLFLYTDIDAICLISSHYLRGSGR